MQIKIFRLALKWIWSRLDLVIALSLSLIFSIVGILGEVSVEVIANANLATLALLSFTLLREQDSRARIQDNLSNTKQSLHLLHSFLESNNNLVQVLQAGQIRTELERAMVITPYWHYKGGCGTYLRAVTIKSIGDQAKYSRTPRTITIQIIDPTNSDVCNTYALYRRSVNSPSEVYLGDWRSDHVRIEAYSTILAACYFQDIYEILKIQLGLCNSMSVFRCDLSSESAVITQEDRTAHALKIPKGTRYYDSYLFEMDLSLRQSRRIQIEDVRGQCLEKLNPDMVGQLFNQLGVFDPSFFDDQKLQKIIDKATNALNPYV